MTSTLNADPAELAKFSELAHRWWDLDGEFRPLHQINPMRLDWINRLCPLKGRRVLDVGCGGGILADAMARSGAQVTGIDLAAKALRVAELHALEAQTANVRYQEVSVEALAQQQPGSFDAVTCMEMLEHVPDPASVVRACAALVKPGRALWNGLMELLEPHAVLISVARRYLDTLDFASESEWAELDRVERPNPYIVRHRRLSLGGDVTTTAIFGKAAQKPFSLISSADKLRIGAAVKELLDAR